MSKLRPIRTEEIELIQFLLLKLNLDPKDYPLNLLVDDYEGGIMGSIGLGKPGATYNGDMIQVEYLDADLTNVVITLTKDTDDQILDLDFWKIDFSKLQQYPTADKIIFNENKAPISNK